MAKYGLVVFDLDGVLVEIKSSWEHVHHALGVDNEDGLAAYISGEIDDMEFMRRDIARWKGRKPGITVKDIEGMLSSVKLSTGAKETVRELKNHGIKCAIISGGIDILAERVGRECGLDYVYANGIACDSGGKLTGEGIPGVTLGKKDQTMQKLIDELKIPAERCVAVGDGIVDVCMFELAGLGIAFNPRDNYTRGGADVIIDKNDLREILKYILVD
jgi:phosphoserine phosphatase